MTTLKTITYRGGVAQFKLPSSWIEEYEPEGGGMFYEAGDDTGTLRINVLDFERTAERATGEQTACDLLRGLDDVIEVEQLPSGNAIARFTESATEEGQELLVYTWHVGVCVSPAHARIIVFTYTILAAQEQNAATQQELEFLDKSITEGEYPAIGGEVGDYYHES